MTTPNFVICFHEKKNDTNNQTVTGAETNLLEKIKPKGAVLFDGIQVNLDLSGKEVS